ncbi:MAG: hypothetical protein ACOYJG_00685 [Prevotella sp.]|jgi:fructoselysine-6-P-deglycase FrlB-like protein
MNAKLKSKLLLLLLLTMTLVSCGSSDNYGYPTKVHFDKDGGTQTCTGSESCYAIDINDYNGNGNATITNGENAEGIATYEWLSVKYGYGNEIEITAQPNNTGKSRTLYVTGWMILSQISR